MKKIIFVISILLVFGFIFSKTAFGIGQVAEPIIIKDVLRGSEIIDTLVLFNSGDKEVVYQLKGEGEIDEWASFYKIDDRKLENSITEISMPAKSRLKATVKFTIPEDAPNGEYTGEVAIMTAPSEDEETSKMGVSVFERIGREVLITVTDKEVLKFETTIIPIKYGVKENDPLQIKIIHDNQGNVSIKPDLQLKIIKNRKTIFNAIFPYPEDENPVRPLERKTLSSLIEWQTTGQENGGYKAEVDVLLNNEVIKKDDFNFTVGGVVAGAEDSKADKLFGFLSSVGGSNPVKGWFIIGGTFLIIAQVLIIINRRKGQKKKI